MATLAELRERYRKQHECMCPHGRGNLITKTHRRQKHFRPRGKVYVRLLKQWAGQP